MDAPQNYSGPFVFFRKHFNGDYSLGRSYWINTFLISMFAPLLGILMLPWLGENFPARYGSAGVLLVTTLGVIAWAWAISGTWASANKHVGRGGRQFWASAAKFMIILGVLRMFGEIGNMTRPLAEHWKIALGGQLGPEISLQVRADGKSILLKGGINDGTAEALSKALDIAPFVTTVVLHSNGGWVRQGNMIAKVIADRRLNTYVEQECTSACTIAFLAGKERSAEPNARIGFHSFRVVGANDKADESSDLETARNTYRQAGLSPSFIAKVVGTSNDKVWYPSHDEMLAEAVLTRQSFGGETATLATSEPTREKLANEFKKIPAFDALSAESYFVPVKLPRGVQLQIPKGWWLLGKDLIRMIGTSVEAAMDLSGIGLPDGQVTNLLAANSMPKTTYAAVRVDSTIPPSIGPSEISALTDADLVEMGTEMRANIEELFSQQDIKLLQFYGVRKDHISGHPVIVTEYRRSGPKGPVIVQINQIFTSSQSIKINLSYRESEAALWKPVVARIRQSIEVTKWP